MNRVVDFEIDGVKFPLCFTLKAWEAFRDRYGTMEQCWQRDGELLQEKDEVGFVEEYLWRLHTLMSAQAERSYSKQLIPTVEGLCDRFCYGDMPDIQQAVLDAVNAGFAREVGAEPGKNGEGGRRKAGPAKLTLPWYLWYGLAIGLSKAETMASPFGELCDLIAIYQIKEEGAEYREIRPLDEEIIPDVP